MEAKLKSQRVADLREILQKASVGIPAKANKADLIAKILASPVAIEAFSNPGSTTSVAALPKPKAPESSHGGQDEDLLAPPEEFDWGPAASNGAQTSPDVPVGSALKSDSKPAVVKSAVSTKESGTEQAAKKSAAPAATGTTEVVQDDELEKRKKRAARFGIPLVEVKPLTTSSSNGTKALRGAPKAQNMSAEEAAKIEARTARFGISAAPGAANATIATSATATPVATTATIATVGQKRGRSPAPVDTQEMERRKKRAERFASGGETKAQT